MDATESSAKFVFTQHALQEMTRRGISQEQVERVLTNPQQVEEVRPGRFVYQSIVEMEKENRAYLLRVFVDVDYMPPRVVTVYRTSKIAKYWRQR